MWLQLPKTKNNVWDSDSQPTFCFYFPPTPLYYFSLSLGKWKWILKSCLWISIGKNLYNRDVSCWLTMLKWILLWVVSFTNFCKISGDNMQITYMGSQKHIYKVVRGYTKIHLILHSRLCSGLKIKWKEWNSAYYKGRVFILRHEVQAASFYLRNLFNEKSYWGFLVD